MSNSNSVSDTPDVTKLKFKGYFDKNHKDFKDTGSLYPEDYLANIVKPIVDNRRSFKRLEKELKKHRLLTAKTPHLSDSVIRIDARTTLYQQTSIETMVPDAKAAEEIKQQLIQKDLKTDSGQVHSLFSCIRESLFYNKKMLSYVRAKDRVMIFSHAIDRFIERCHITNYQDALKLLMESINLIEHFRYPMDICFEGIGITADNLILIPVPGKGLMMGVYTFNSKRSFALKEEQFVSDADVFVKETFYYGFRTGFGKSIDKNRFSSASTIVFKTFISLNEMKPEQRSYYDDFMEWTESSNIDAFKRLRTFTHALLHKIAVPMFVEDIELNEEVETFVRTFAQSNPFDGVEEDKKQSYRRVFCKS